MSHFLNIDVVVREGMYEKAQQEWDNLITYFRVIIDTFRWSSSVHAIFGFA